MRKSVMEPHDKYQAHKPRRGDLVTYKGHPHGTVTSVDGSICWIAPIVEVIPGFAPAPRDAEPNMFIWCFHDGLNTLHDWPAKHPDLMQESAEGHGNLKAIGREP